MLIYNYKLRFFDDFCLALSSLATFSDSLELVDLTGRVVREDKRGAIDLTLQPILTRLNIPSESWLLIATQFEDQTHSAVGSEQVLTQYCQSIGQKRRSGITQSKRLFV